MGTVVVPPTSPTRILNSFPDECKKEKKNFDSRENSLIRYTDLEV